MHVSGQYNDVFKVDFSGAYPSTLIALNLSPELFIKYENVSDENLIKCEKQSKYYHQNNTKIIQIIDKQSNRQGYLHICDENEGVLTRCVRQLKQLKDDQKIYKDNNDPRYSPSK